MKAQLEEHADQARLSRQLTELEAQVPLTVDLDSLHPGPQDREALRQLFVELEFSRLVKELGFESRPEGTCSLVQDPEDLDRVVQAVREAGEPQAGSLCHMGLAFVMSEQHPVLAEVAGVGLAWQTGEGAYIPLAPREPNRTIWEKLGPVWSDAGIAKVGADLKAALILAQRFGLDLAGITGDILVASYLLDPARYEQTLGKCRPALPGGQPAGSSESAGRPPRGGVGPGSRLRLRRHGPRYAQALAPVEGGTGGAGLWDH